MMKAQTLVFLDGKRAEGREASLLVFDERMLSVFETMRVEQGVIFRLEDHLDRLFESAKTIGLSMDKDRAAHKKMLRAVISHIPFASPFFLRHMATDRHAVTFAFSRAYSDQAYREGADLRTATVRRNPSNALPPEAKSSQCLNGVLATADPSSRHMFEVLFLDAEGHLAEARVWNFFLVRAGVLVTPPAAGILNGVTRRFVIECANREAIEVEESPVSRHELWNADEAFLTNAIGGIVPVRSVDGRLIGPEAPGPLTVRLSRRFQQALKHEVRQHSHASD